MTSLGRARGSPKPNLAPNPHLTPVGDSRPWSRRRRTGEQEPFGTVTTSCEPERHSRRTTTLSFVSTQAGAAMALRRAGASFGLTSISLTIGTTSTAFPFGGFAAHAKTPKDNAIMGVNIMRLRLSRRNIITQCS